MLRVHSKLRDGERDLEGNNCSENIISWRGVFVAHNVCEVDSIYDN